MKNVKVPNKTKSPIVTVSIVPGKGTLAQIRQFRAAFARLIAKANEVEHE
jgi:phosphoribulokinase